MLGKLQANPNLIVHIHSYEHRRRETVEQFKAVAQLADGSRLHINEVWIAGQLKKYAYYWLSPTGDILQGWDNAPHHPEIETYPNHTHYAGSIYPSDIQTLSQVLSFLRGRIL